MMKHYLLKRSFVQNQKMNYRCVQGIYKLVNANDNGAVYLNLNGHDASMYASGIVNMMWQSWNRFWRTFWMAQIFGGFSLDNKKIVPLHLSRAVKNENEAIFYVLFLLGKKRYPSGAIIGSYQEPTWGSVQTIQEIAAQWPNKFDHILNALSVYGTTIKHFQIVRNAIIHIDNDNMYNIKVGVMPHYRISNIMHPVDILFSKNISTGKTAIVTWEQELRAMLLMI